MKMRSFRKARGMIAVSLILVIFLIIVALWVNNTKKSVSDEEKTSEHLSELLGDDVNEIICNINDSENYRINIRLKDEGSAFFEVSYKYADAIAGYFAPDVTDKGLKYELNFLNYEGIESHDLDTVKLQYRNYLDNSADAPNNKPFYHKIMFSTEKYSGEALSGVTYLVIYEDCFEDPSFFENFPDLRTLEIVAVNSFDSLDTDKLKELVSRHIPEGCIIVIS